MPVKAIVVQKLELQDAVENILKNEGKTITSLELTVNEESGEDVALVNTNGDTFEREIGSMIPQFNQHFSVEINKYDGFDYPEFAGQSGGYVFLIN